MNGWFNLFRSPALGVLKRCRFIKEWEDPIIRRRLYAPQLYSRIGFAHEMEPLSDEETRDFLGKRWSHRVKASSDDFTDKEAVAAILRITRGNIRLIERLMMQVEHVLVANQLQVVTQEVVETARENLIIGTN